MNNLKRPINKAFPNCDDNSRNVRCKYSKKNSSSIYGDPLIETLMRDMLNSNIETVHKKIGDLVELIAPNKHNKGTINTDHL